jgi:hypothetical protein
VIRAAKSRANADRLGSAEAGADRLGSAEAGARALGWAGLAAGAVAEHVAPGDHDTMLDLPAVAVLAGALEKWLDQIGGS